MKESPIKINVKPRILVLIAHPDPAESVANKVMLEAIRPLPNVTVRDLYALYPDFYVDVAVEQDILQQHDIIVFQHPFYLYSCPSLMKEWMDRVLCKGFAFGSVTRLKGKVWRNVITTGGKEEAFSPEGYNQYPLTTFLKPFELTAALCCMQWMAPLVLYWARGVSKRTLREHADHYKQWLENPLE